MVPADGGTGGPLVGQATAEKLVVAGTIEQVVFQSSPEHARAIVEAARVRADADVTIERFRTKRRIVITVIACGTLLIALWSPALAALFGSLGALLNAYLVRVEQLATTMNSAAGAGGSTSDVADALRQTQWPFAKIALTVLIVSVSIVLGGLLGNASPSPPRPAVADAGSDASTDAKDDVSGIVAPPSPTREPLHPEGGPLPPQLDAIWSPLVRALDEELGDCDERWLASRRDAGPIFFEQNFSLADFSGVGEVALVERIGRPRTNAPAALRECYDSAVSAVIEKYFFKMPAGERQFDQMYRHIQSR